jgi:[ribosomal protein S5]-alanine N-acetyltransferase
LGQGCATELTRACTFLADDVLKLPEVHAFANPKNIGSQRVLEKAGFQLMRFTPNWTAFSTPETAAANKWLRRVWA